MTQKSQSRDLFPEPEMIGESPALKAVLKLVSKVAPTNHTVLIQGESGVGKELIARAVHSQSRRKNNPFVVVDCGLLNENLLQNELFGHQRGAFTGATALKHGLFEVADSGTLFLDEIGEISPVVQGKLLRVLETSTFRRLGSTVDTRVDVRLVAATNRELLQLCQKGVFREDLYFRLNVFPVSVPTLRERPEDIPRLARHILQQLHPGKEALGFSTAAMNILLRYRWPGNIRELQNVTESAAILAEGPEILPRDLPLIIRPQAGPADLNLSKETISLKELEKRYITALLYRFNGHRAKVAKVLQISERNLYRKLKDYHLMDLQLHKPLTPSQE